MIAFPLLVANAISFLGGGDLAPSLVPGRNVNAAGGAGHHPGDTGDPETASSRRLPIEQGIGPAG